MGPDVAVAEAEPGRLHAVGGKLGAGVPGLVRSAPSALPVDPAAEGIHDAVEVGTDAQAVQGDVVTGIDHGGDLSGGVGGTYTPQEPSTADATREHRQPHVVEATRSAIPSGMRPAAAVLTGCVCGGRRSPRSPGPLGRLAGSGPATSR